MSSLQQFGLRHPISRITTSGATTTLINTSNVIQYFDGSADQIVVLPNATGMKSGRGFYISNRSTGKITIQDFSSTILQVLPKNTDTWINPIDVSTSAGTWDISQGLGGGGGGGGGIISDWLAYTPTGSWTTNTSYAGKYRRVGSDMEIEVVMSFTGTPDNTALTVAIPSGFTIDTAKFPPSVDAYHPLGLGTMKQGAGNAYFLKVNYNDTTTVNVFAMIVSGSYGQEAGLSASIPTGYTSGDQFGLKFRVPIVGWSSTVATGGLMYSHISIAGLASGYTSIGTDGDIIYDTAIYDPDGAYNTTNGKYTVQQTGFLLVAVEAQGSAGSVLEVKINGAIYTYLGGYLASADSSHAAVVPVTAGDFVTIGSQTSSLYTGFTPYVNYVSFAQFPNAFAKSKIQVSNGNGVGSVNNIVRRFTTLVTSVGSDIAYSDSATLGASFTINSEGTYAITYNDISSSATTIAITVNSTGLTGSGIIADTTFPQRVASASQGPSEADSVSYVGKFSLGDVIRAQCDSGTNGTSDIVNVTIERIG